MIAIKKQTKAIRHEIYDWLKEEGFDLTEGRMSHLSSLIQEHSAQHTENMKEQIKSMEEHMKRCALARREQHAKRN